MDTENVTVTLSQPIRTLRENGLAELTELHIRAPLGVDLIATGYPLSVGAENAGVDAGIMAALIARCANTTIMAVNSMALGDWNNAMTAVLGFWSILPEQADPDAITLDASLTLLDGTMVDKLTFRPPVGGDLVAIGGYPMRAGGGDAFVDPSKITALIARLSGASKDSIAALPAGTWGACMRRVLDFFTVAVSGR